MIRRVLLPVAFLGVAVPAVAAEYVPPPIMPIPTAWQGRSTGLIRVLDKLDAHTEMLTLTAGQTGHYKNLSVTLRACMDRPDGMPHDSAAFLDVQDTHGNGQPFTGWTFANEPSIGVFESPIYGVQLVNCQGDQVAPAAPPLPAPVPAPPGLIRNAPSPPPDSSDENGDDMGGEGDPSQPDISPGGSDPGRSPPAGQPPAPAPSNQPPVYPDVPPPP